MVKSPFVTEWAFLMIFHVPRPNGGIYPRYIENLEIHAECASKVNAWIEIGEALK